MSLVRYCSLNSIDALNRQINRLFEDDRLLSWKEANDDFFVPSAEISETKEAILLKLEIPGMDAKDLDVQVSKDEVTISGERKEEAKTKAKTEEKGHTRSEFRYGSFHSETLYPEMPKVERSKRNTKTGFFAHFFQKQKKKETKSSKLISVNPL